MNDRTDLSCRDRHSRRPRNRLVCRDVS